MTEPPPLVRLRGAGRRFGRHVALHQVDLTVAAGERIGILGASGAGKSTLLALLNGSLTASDGSVEVFGEDLRQASSSRLRVVQRRVGTVSQRLDLIDQVRVLHNVNAGRLGRWSAGRALASLVWPAPDNTAREALDRVGLGWAVHERTERLSGGEQQRVAIARLLVQQPELVLADEPVASLDPVRAAEVLDLLTTAAAGGALVVSLHQPDLALRWCSRVVGLHRGQVAFDVPVSQLDEQLLDRLYHAA